MALSVFWHVAVNCFVTNKFYVAVLTELTCGADSIYRHVVQTNADGIVNTHGIVTKQRRPTETNTHGIVTKQQRPTHMAQSRNSGDQRRPTHMALSRNSRDQRRPTQRHRTAETNTHGIVTDCIDLPCWGGIAVDVSEIYGQPRTQHWRDQCPVLLHLGGTQE